jgi:thiamine biosynthesis lipoprotein
VNRARVAALLIGLSCFALGACGAGSSKSAPQSAAPPATTSVSAADSPSTTGSTPATGATASADTVRRSSTPFTIASPDSGDARPTAQRARYLMGTFCTVEGQGADTAKVAASLVASLNEIARLEKIMTPWDSLSELRLLNKRAGQTLAVTQDLFAVVDSAIVFAKLTKGAFDPTVEPLIQAWDLRGDGKVPTDDELSDARSKVGYQLVDMGVDTPTIFCAVIGYGIDLGGIGKGFALDRAASLLKFQNVSRARLNLGGQLMVFSDGRPWPVAIADPEKRMTPAVRFALAQGSVSTSGQSEHGFVKNGVRYGHILDPATGRPVVTRASVTVVAASGTRADALSTGLLVMGRERAAAFAERHPEIGVLWLEPTSSGLQAWKWHFPSGATLEPGVRWMN